MTHWQVTQRDGTFYLAFKYDASEMMCLSIFWGLDTVALASSVEQWNVKHAAEAAAQSAAAGRCGLSAAARELCTARHPRGGCCGRRWRPP